MRKAKYRIIASFTPKECSIRDMICDGMTNSDIATELHTSEQMVKNWIGAMFSKVGCGNRIEFFHMVHLTPAELQHNLEMRELELQQQLEAVRKELNFVRNRGTVDEENLRIAIDFDAVRSARRGIASILSDVVQGCQ